MASNGSSSWVPQISAPRPDNPSLLSRPVGAPTNVDQLLAPKKSKKARKDRKRSKSQVTNSDEDGSPSAIPKPSAKKPRKSNPNAPYPTGATAGLNLHEKHAVNLPQLESNRAERRDTLIREHKLDPELPANRVYVVNIKMATKGLPYIAGYLNMHCTSELGFPWERLDPEMNALYARQQVCFVVNATNQKRTTYRRFVSAKFHIFANRQ